MINKPLIIIVLLLFFKYTAEGQETKEFADIQIVLDRFVEGVSRSDTLLLRKTIDPNVGFLTVFNDKKKSILTADVVESFFESVKTHRNVKYYEEQQNCIIHSDNIIATAWCDYVFYTGEKISHCGINTYQLYKTRRGWKIIQVTDSRHNTNCKPFEK